MAALIRVIPLSLEEDRTRRININKCATLQCSYYKSIWRSINNSKLELTNRTHVLNFCYIFILSILSCLGMASSIISISAVFFMRFDYFDQYSSLIFGIVLAATDMVMILAVAVASVYYFISFNRAVIIILGALNTLAIGLYLLCILLYEDFTLGLLLLLIWRVLLGLGGLVQVMGVFYSCSFSQVQKEIKRNYFSTMLVAYHTSNYIQVWTSLGPLLGLVFVSLPNPLSSSSKVYGANSSTISLLFNGFTACMWVVAILMLIFLAYFMNHYNTIKRDVIVANSDSTALTPPSSPSAIIPTDVIRSGGGGRGRRREVAGEDTNAQDRPLHDLVGNNYNSSDSSSSGGSSGESSGSDGRRKIWRWLDLELLSNRNIEAFNLINYSHIKTCKDGVSDHKKKGLSLVHTSLILLLSSEVLLVFVFYGYFWNLASIAIGCNVIIASDDFYVVYISIILGASSATFLTWNLILEKLNRYKFTCLSHGQSLYPFMSGAIFGISCMLSAVILLTINSFLLDHYQPFHDSNSPSILYHSASFLMGLGFCYAFVSSEDAIFFLSSFVSASDSQLLFNTDIHTSDLNSNLTSTLSPMPQCPNVDTSNIDCHASNSSTYAAASSSSSSSSSSSFDAAYRSRSRSLLGVSEQDSFGHHWFRIKVVHVLRFVTICFGRLAGVVTTSTILTFVPLDNNNLDPFISNSSSSNISSLGSVNITGLLFDNSYRSKCSIPWLTAAASNSTAVLSYSPCQINNLSHVAIVYFGISLAAFVIYLVLFNKIIGDKSLRYLTGKTLDRFTATGFGHTSKADKLELSRLQHLGFDVNIDVME